jgi:hypothetical protein
MRRLIATALALALAAGAAGAAHAQDAPICTDRPAKANAVCTVPAGTVQVETATLDWTLTEDHGTRTELLTLGASTLKLGLSDSADLEIALTPYAVSTTRGGSPARVSGIGDLLVRTKQRLTRPNAPVQIAILPFLKLPTAAHGLGNGKLEAGLAIPISLTLAGQLTLTLGPELDALANPAGHGRHLALVNLVNLSAPLAPRLTLSAELWTNLNFQPGGTVKQASADAAWAYALTKDVQLDVGANVGLTRATADVEAYAGVSLRF